MSCMLVTAAELFEDCGDLHAVQTDVEAFAAHGSEVELAGWRWQPG